VYATKTCGGDGGIAPLIPNLDARWTLTAPYSEVRDRVTKLVAEWKGSREGEGDLEQNKINFLPPTGHRSMIPHSSSPSLSNHMD